MTRGVHLRLVVMADTTFNGTDLTLGTLAVTPECRRLAQRACSLLKDASTAAAVVDTTGQYVWVNSSFASLLGRPAGEVAGLRFADLGHADDVDVDAHEHAAVVEGGAQASPSLRRYRRPDGAQVWAMTSLTALPGTSGSAAAVLVQIDDQTARRETDRRTERMRQLYGMVAAAGEAIMQAGDPVELLRSACRVVVEQGRYPLVWAGLVDPADEVLETVAWAAGAGAGEDELRAAGAPPQRPATDTTSATDPTDAGDLRLTDPKLSASPTSTALRTAHHVICTDLASVPMPSPWRTAALARGCCSLVVLPLLSGDRAVAVLALYDTETGFGDEQVEMLDTFARDISFGLTMLQREQQCQAAENDVRDAQRYARSLIEASLHLLVTISAEGKVTDVNEAVVRATGVPRARLIGSDFAGYFTDPDKAREGCRQVFQQEVVADYPLTLRHVSGTTVDVRCDASIYRDAKGQVVGALAAARDVTRRNRAEESARRLATVVESSEDAIISKSLDGTILSWNPGAQRLYGYAAGEIVGKSISVLVPTDRHGELREVLQRVGRGEHVTHFETVRQPRRGPPLDVSLSVSPLRDAEGHIVGASTIARDISARKRAEQEVRAVSAYNRSLIEASIDPLVTVDPAGLITDVNAAAETVTGYSRADLIGTEFSRYFTDPDLARAGYEQAFCEGAVRDCALQLRHSDGHTTPVLFNATVYRDPSGQVLGVFAAARDVTQQRVAEAEVRSLNAELEARVEQRTAELKRANRNLETFSYSVSHDLRAPLRALSGFSEALLEEYGDALDDMGRDYAQRIAAASQRMAKLIDDLLHLSRVSREEMHLQTVDLSAEVAAIADDLQQRERQRRVRFVIQPGVRAWADRRLAKTMLENLLGNAWKFTSGRDEAVIEFGVIPTENAAVCCYVRDNGAGFDADYVNKLFQPFQRLHTLQQFPGTGIGLASVRRIVERHGGHTWAESSLDHGATFYFTLDLRETP